MMFSSLVGNERAKAFLGALSQAQSIPQVFLFFGPSGVGKKRFALEFTKLLLGKKHEKKMDLKIHPDVLHFFPEGKTHQHPLSSIQTLLKQATIPPFEASVKVCILEEAERMLPSSSNALLKLLEEPNSFCRFILLTSRLDEILPTIASRCCKVPFYPVEESLLESYLVKEKNLSFKQARQVAMRSEGSFVQADFAMQSMEDPIHLLFMDLLQSFFLSPPSLPFFERLNQLEKWLEKQGEEESTLPILDRLLGDLLFWLRDLHLLQRKAKAHLFHEAYQEKMKEQLKKGGIPSLEKACLLIEKARLGLQRSVKPKVVLEQLFFALT